MNLGKRSISLDLKDPESLAVVFRLLEQCDVFLANFTQRALIGLYPIVTSQYSSLNHFIPGFLSYSVPVF